MRFQVRKHEETIKQIRNELRIMKRRRRKKKKKKNKQNKMMMMMTIKMKILLKMESPYFGLP